MINTQNSYRLTLFIAKIFTFLSHSFTRAISARWTSVDYWYNVFATGKLRFNQIKIYRNKNEYRKFTHSHFAQLISKSTCYEYRSSKTSFSRTSNFYKMYAQYRVGVIYGGSSLNIGILIIVSFDNSLRRRITLLLFGSILRTCL